VHSLVLAESSPSNGVLRNHLHIVVENPERRCTGVATVELDGVPADPGAVPLLDDGGGHQVRVVLGAARKTPSSPSMTAVTSGSSPATN